MTRKRVADPDFGPRLQHGGADRGRDARRTIRPRSRWCSPTGPMPTGLARARAAGIATAVVDHTAFGKDREAFERALQAALEAHRIELVCLAGFMRLLTPWFVERWQGRMLNIHPSLLPRLQGPRHARARARAPASRLHGAPCISSCRRWMPARSSRRRACRCCPATRRTRWPRACSRPSTASIPLALRKRVAAGASGRTAAPSPAAEKQNPRPAGSAP